MATFYRLTSEEKQAIQALRGDFKREPGFLHGGWASMPATSAREEKKWV
jgi:hypothetical protein